MNTPCDHLATIKAVTPSAKGCEERLAIGERWLHLRVCRTCGHVGCCDQSRGRHATAHYRASGRPIIEGYGPLKGWGLVLCRRSHDRPRHRRDAAGRADPALLLMRAGNATLR